MSKLYIVATPIGNLQDISLRALEVFKSVDIIVCEDTRVTGKLLNRYKIKKPLLSFHQHSSKSASHKVIELLREGKDLAYVSDAGTPGIQDPGNKLIATLLQSAELRIKNYELRKAKIEIIPIPGVSALIALASVSGLPTDSFLFLGFLPKKKGRQKFLQEIADSKRTVVFYESSHRIVKTLKELDFFISQPEFSSGHILQQAQDDKKIMQHDSQAVSRRVLNNNSNRQLVVGRELTKKFETIYRGSAGEIIEQLKKTSIKGEFVVAIAGNKI